MCVNYTPTRKALIEEKFQAIDQTKVNWKSEIWQDYPAPFITHDDHGRRQVLLGNYSMIPKHRIPPGVKRFSTMNARAETIAELRSYAKPWRDGHLCLIPLQDFFEPNYESGKAERWQIGLQELSDFAVAGVYRSWEPAENEDEEQTRFSFTQITINADEHPLMKRFHKAGEEKRSLVIVQPADFDLWLSCRNPALARTFLQLYPAEKMWTKPAAPSQTRTVKKVTQKPSESPEPPRQASLI
jgi:putative SOS response-associated peptidase YedK